MTCDRKAGQEQSTDSTVHQMVNFNRDQADIIRKVFCPCDLLNLGD
jgi:hypothetical protein